MKDKKYADDDPERTLVTLDQLSQTIEVMTSVVNRLRRHLSDQIKAQLEEQEKLNSTSAATVDASNAPEAEVTKSADSKPGDDRRESFVVEINQQEIEPVRKSPKVLH